jgi:hypothetical protein
MDMDLFIVMYIDIDTDTGIDTDADIDVILMLILAFSLLDNNGQILTSNWPFFTLLCVTIAVLNTPSRCSLPKLPHYMSLHVLIAPRFPNHGHFNRVETHDLITCITSVYRVLPCQPSSKIGAIRWQRAHTIGSTF